MATPGSILKLQPNVPEVIALAFSEGKPVVSDFTGEQILFSLVDGRRYYAPPYVAQLIKNAGIGARTPFEICKKQKGREVDYQITTANNQTTRLVNMQDVKQMEAAEVIKFGPSKQATGAFVENAPAVTASVESTTPHRTPGQTSAPASKLMMAALCAAIDAVTEAENYSKRKGMTAEFTSEDIRCIANTLYIQACKGGAQ